MKNKQEFKECVDDIEEGEWRLVEKILKPTKESPVMNNVKCGRAPFTPDVLWRMVENNTKFTSIEATSKAMQLQDNVHESFKTVVPDAKSSQRYIYHLIDNIYLPNLRNVLKLLMNNGKVQLEVDCSTIRTREGSLPCLAMNAHIFEPYGLLDAEQIDKQQSQQGNRDSGTQGRRDSGTQGLRDAGTQGRRDSGTQGLRDSGTQGLRDAGTQGLRDAGTQGLRDAGTQGRRDSGTQGLMDSGTQGLRYRNYGILLHS